MTARNEACRWLDGFVKWLDEGGCTILDRDSGQMISLGPAMNDVQGELLGRMYQMAYDGQPIRLLVPKARKLGVSTFAQALAYFLCGNLPSFAAVTASHSADGTADLWQITQRIFDGDPNKDGARCSNRRISWAHGSTFSTKTGGGHEIGRGGTLRFLHISEFASWHIGKKADQDRTSLTAIRNSLPKHQPNTILIIESTGQGPAGEFYAQCMQASSSSDRALFFVPWSADCRYKLQPPADFEPTTDETALATRHGLDTGQVYWRRQTIADPTDFNNRTIDFKREFPITLEECFEAAAGRVHPEFSRETHVRALNWTKDQELGRYRAIDWGGRDPFVCLWLVHLAGPPGLSVDPGCESLCKELFAYRRDPDSHEPIHDASHGPCALRYAVTTFYLTHHVHIYREFYEPHHSFGGRNLLELAEHVHSTSDWLEVAPHVWECGAWGETFTGGVADRSRPDSIQLFNAHGFDLIGQVNLNTRKAGHSAQHKTEVEQGIDRVNELVLATVPIDQPAKPLTDVERRQRELRTRRYEPVPVTERSGDRVLTWLAQRKQQARRRALHPVLGSVGR